MDINVNLGAPGWNIENLGPKHLVSWVRLK